MNVKRFEQSFTFKLLQELYETLFLSFEHFVYIVDFHYKLIFILW